MVDSKSTRLVWLNLEVVNFNHDRFALSRWASTPYLLTNFNEKSSNSPMATPLTVINSLSVALRVEEAVCQITVVLYLNSRLGFVTQQNR